MKHLNCDVNKFWISRLWDAVKLEQKVEKVDEKSTSTIDSLMPDVIRKMAGRDISAQQTA